MSKELRELLNKINTQKGTIRALVKEGKTQEAQTAKTVLQDMQNQFNILMDIEDDDAAAIEGKLESGGAQHIDGNKQPQKKDISRAFVNRIVYGLRGKQLPADDAKIMNLMTEADPDDDGISSGGFTVPQDIQTDIIELRRTSDDLEQYVNTEAVSTKSGSRVIEVDADSTPWADVDEGAAFSEAATPTFKQIKYEIKKRGGILKVTGELLKDTAVNILGYLNPKLSKNK